MNSASFGVLAQKFETLTDQAKEEVVDFIDFLIEKKRLKRKTKKIDKKNVLLGMSYWSEEDIKIFDDIRKDMNKWKPEAF